MKWTNVLFISFILLLTACGPEQLEKNPSLTPINTIQPTPSPLPSPVPSPTHTPQPTPSPLPSPSPTTASAPPPGISFHLVSPDDGLPPGKIHDLWIGPHGSLWVATEVGIFVHSSDTWEALYAGSVAKLIGADRDGRVWAILEGGSAIMAYEPSGEWTVYSSAEGWLAPPDPEYLSPGYGDGFVTDPEGNLWFATGLDDLRRFDPQSQTWKSFRADEIAFDPPGEAGYQGHFLTDVELSRNQKVWVSDCIGMGEALLGQGIRWFDGENWFEAPYTFDECVFDIEIDPIGRMWTGAFDALMTYDPDIGQWSSIPLPPYERTQLVRSIDLDDEGNPWIEIMRYGGASSFGEIARYHLSDGSWVEDFIGMFSRLAFDEMGVAWLCSGGDVFRLENGQRAAVGRVPSGFCDIVVDGNGRVWISGTENLWWFEPSPTESASPMVTPTFSEADWAKLPPLAEVMLTPEEIFSEVLIPEEAFTNWQDATQELQTECQFDCAKRIMHTANRDMTQLTLMLMRAGNPDEGQAIVESRLDEVLNEPNEYGTHLYSQSELSTLRHAPPNTWIVDQTLREISVGANYGPVVLLMEWRYDHCTTLEDGTKYCEGDIFNVAVMVIEIAIRQLAKLEEAGYPQP